MKAYRTYLDSIKLVQTHCPIYSILKLDRHYMWKADCQQSQSSLVYGKLTMVYWVYLQDAFVLSGQTQPGNTILSKTFLNFLEQGSREVLKWR